METSLERNISVPSLPTYSKPTHVINIKLSAVTTLAVAIAFSVQEFAIVCDRGSWEIKGGNKD